MRKIKILQAVSPQVLVYDTIGSSWIDYCIPTTCSYLTICLRKTLPVYLNCRFISRLLQLLVRNFRKHPGWLSYTLLSALIDHAAPLVILTAADNSRLLARYAAEHKELPVIFIQNALRGVDGESMPFDITLPIYLSMGSIEAQIFRKIGVPYRKCIPIGSVKMGIVMAQTQKQLDDNHTYDLCFISHYRPDLIHSVQDNLLSQIERNQRLIFSHLCSYARSRKLSVAILSKTRDHFSQDEERSYFSDIADGVNFTFIRADKKAGEFNTYYAGLVSTLIIHPTSTLGFEFLGAGKRVLFGASANPSLPSAWGIEIHFDLIPDYLKLNNDSAEEFFSKADTLRSMPLEQYQTLVRPVSDLFMSSPPCNYPHDFLCSTILEVLSHSSRS